QPSYPAATMAAASWLTVQLAEFRSKPARFLTNLQLVPRPKLRNPAPAAGCVCRPLPAWHFGPSPSPAYYVRPYPAEFQSKRIGILPGRVSN
ncbi:MAG: hypothetical protein KDB22_21430, partial [Planctomycetales bacterium]|nr:hypothetical protein [Planctomycetales bacterium]